MILSHARTAFAALAIIASVASAGTDAAAQASSSALHEPFDRLLHAYVRDGRVDYAGLKRSPDLLHGYLTRLEQVDRQELSGWPVGDRLAFWINAYNAYTLALVVEHYPVAGIWSVTPFWRRAFGGPFSLRFIPLGHLAPTALGAELSLDQVEHEIVRKTFVEPRIHAALVCASKGCPILQPHAYAGPILDAQLDVAMRGFLADPTKNRYEPEQATLYISPIFQWFHEDFEPMGGPIGYFSRYGPATASAALRAARETPTVRYTDYDWSLND